MELKVTPQMQMQARAMFDQMRAEQLAAVEYPHELGDNFLKHLRKALMYNSFDRLQCPYETYRVMVFMHRKPRLVEVQLMCRVLEAATPIELEQQHVKENIEFLDNVVCPIRMICNDIDMELSEKIKSEVEVKCRITQGVPENKKRGIITH